MHDRDVDPFNLLVIDDEASLRRTLRTALESMGHRVAEAANGAQALECPPATAVRPRVPRPAPRQGERTGLAARTAPGGPRPARRHHHRPRQPRLGRRGDAEGRVRLPAQAVHAEPTPGRTRPVGPGPRVAEPGRGSGGAGRATRSGRGTRHGRAGRAQGAGGRLPGRPDRRDGPAARRERDRQGGARPGHPRPEQASRSPVRHRPLPEPVGGAAGERSVRARQGGVHRSGCRQGGQGRGGRRRDAVPRRDRRPAAGPPAEAAAAAPGQDVRAGRRTDPADGRRADHGGHEPRPGGRGAGRPLPRGPVLPAQRDRDHAAPAPDIGGATCSRSPGTCSASSPARPGRRSPASLRRPRRR